ncbi:Transthyretin-like family protein [Ancylostoma caninum]|uniref:Transthyretin-like family protein n=1 Tax=Ancylostoma caninum TaxID=29170 RepID=A0A368G5U5_ANCCA|nr:Transthyretin-like family protein [Ancylostoma caninum]
MVNNNTHSILAATCFSLDVVIDLTYNQPGKRKLKFYIPKSYITSGKIPKKEFDIGVLNLETIFPKEERELIVSRKRRHRKHKVELDDDSGSSLFSRRQFKH